MIKQILLIFMLLRMFQLPPTIFSQIRRPEMSSRPGPGVSEDCSSWVFPTTSPAVLHFHVHVFLQIKSDVNSSKPETAPGEDSRLKFTSEVPLVAHGAPLKHSNCLVFVRLSSVQDTQLQQIARYQCSHLYFKLQMIPTADAKSQRLEVRTSQSAVAWLEEPNITAGNEILARFRPTILTQGCQTFSS